MQKLTLRCDLCDCLIEHGMKHTGLPSVDAAGKESQFIVC